MEQNLKMDFEAFLKNCRNIAIVAALDPKTDFVKIDLTETNPDLEAMSVGNADAFEQYFGNYVRQKKAKAAYGGYNEKRTLYKRSAIFNNNPETERNIHIGLDVWTTLGTAVLAALEGTVHSFNFNPGLGNYGPTIILKHSIDDQEFYTLYGHLSLESIAGLEIGQVFGRGAIIGWLGTPAVNGDYAPHLHFQIIKDIGDHFGDYPGVCSKKDLDYYLRNCPDPNVLLKIN